MSIRPIDLEIARTILLIGQFVPQSYEVGKDPAAVRHYMRKVPEENGAVNAAIDLEALHLSLSPAVSVFAGHHGKRRMAAIMLEIAARYAEKVDGEIVQHANVVGCTEDGHQQRHLASYPSQPLDFAQVCAGWQQEFMTVETP